MSGLNIILGYDNDADKYICGIYLFWTLYEWLPLWGTILSLLFLSRTAMHNNRNRTTTGASNRSIVSDDTTGTGTDVYSHSTSNTHNTHSNNTLPHSSNNTTLLYNDIRSPLVGGDGDMGDGDGFEDDRTGGSDMYGDDGELGLGSGLGGDMDDMGGMGSMGDGYDTPYQPVHNTNTYYTDITQHDDGYNYNENNSDNSDGSGGNNNNNTHNNDIDNGHSSNSEYGDDGGRMTHATYMTDDHDHDIGTFRNRTDRPDLSGLSGRTGLDTPSDSLQNQSDLYNYDIQNAMTGGNYSYRYSTMTNNQDNTDNTDNT